MSPPHRSIATCSPASEDVAILELQALGIGAKPLAPGILLCEGKESATRISEAAMGAAVIFVRHLFPVQFEIGMLDSLANLVSATPTDLLAPRSTIAAQVRTFGSTGAFSRQEVTDAFEEHLRSHGAKIQRKNPAQVLSIVLAGGIAYGGICDTSLALSSWPGGEIRLRKDADQICRAESKLIEACQVFGVDLVSGQRALDLGAAPGGWSRVLALHGLSVVAVDPAELAEACSRINLIHHQRITAQEFLVRNRDELFSIIVNDMRMDADQSAALMCDMSGMLDSGGLAIITLKLEPQAPKAMLRKIADAREILEQRYHVLAIRQLFHNRNEVTVLAEHRTIPAN